jgi:hypothetical protein
MYYELPMRQTSATTGFAAHRSDKLRSGASARTPSALILLLTSP